ncbi:MAG: ABC transporter permease [Proteobacteria bacterium]|nr:ABC transporter permease [Pseudomonadota bacterium]MBU1710662.1 ABC transporter permease [Pseudomonadota bacterium]
MGRLFASAHKELLLLWRDRAGMLVLFVMPAVLVLVITLVQENIYKITGESQTNVLFVDNDKSDLGSAIENELKKLGAINLVKDLDGGMIDAESMIAAIQQGDYQFGVLVPEALTESLRKSARIEIERTFSQEKVSSEALTASDIVVYFDPAVRVGFRAAVINLVDRVVIRNEVKEKIAAFSEKLPGEIGRMIRETMGPIFERQFALGNPQMNFSWSEERIVAVREELAFKSGYERTPSSVQQNVPAWSLFGIFFIVVPMAGSLIVERQEGTLARLLTMPVSYLTLLSGKVMAYLLVCCCQFALIVLIGLYLLPVLGTPALEMGSGFLPVIAVLFSAALAATGYGIMLGTISRTFEQASMFGAISVVIAAALGGIMVPVYAMPKIMQQISVVSPLNWALEAFMDIFVRGGGISDVVPEIACLLGFFAMTMIIGWIFLFRKVRSGL